MTFDPSITMGALLNAAVLLIGFVVAFTRIGGRIDLLAQRMQNVEKALDAAADTNSTIATLQERVTNHGAMLATAQRDISDLRHGQGFITSHRHSIDGEYK